MKLRRWIRNRIYRYVDKRNRIPWLARFVYPYAHWCLESDGLLILSAQDMLFNCHCSVREDFVRINRVHTVTFGDEVEFPL